MFTVGTDIVSCKRIEKAMENERFLERIFTVDELELFKSKGKSALQTISGNFAAKEAVMKALGTGLRNMKWKDIEILRNELGAPYVRLSGGAAEEMEKAGITGFEISISHERDYAVCFVIGVKERK